MKTNNSTKWDRNVLQQRVYFMLSHELQIKIISLNIRFTITENPADSKSHKSYTNTLGVVLKIFYFTSQFCFFCHPVAEKKSRHLNRRFYGESNPKVESNPLFSEQYIYIHELNWSFPKRLFPNFKNVTYLH